MNNSLITSWVFFVSKTNKCSNKSRNVKRMEKNHIHRSENQIPMVRNDAHLNQCLLYTCEFDILNLWPYRQGSVERILYHQTEIQSRIKINHFRKFLMTGDRSLMKIHFFSNFPAGENALFLHSYGGVGKNYQAETFSYCLRMYWVLQ